MVLRVFFSANSLAWSEDDDCVDCCHSMQRAFGHCKTQKKCSHGRRRPLAWSVPCLGLGLNFRQRFCIFEGIVTCIEMCPSLPQIHAFFSWLRSFVFRDLSQRPRGRVYHDFELFGLFFIFFVSAQVVLIVSWTTRLLTTIQCDRCPC